MNDRDDVAIRSKILIDQFGVLLGLFALWNTGSISVSNFADAGVATVVFSVVAAVPMIAYHVTIRYTVSPSRRRVKIGAFVSTVLLWAVAGILTGDFLLVGGITLLLQPVAAVIVVFRRTAASST